MPSWFFYKSGSVGWSKLKGCRWWAIEGVEMGSRVSRWQRGWGSRCRWWALMSLLIRYAHIPFYFPFSFTSFTSLIHHYTLRPHMTVLALAWHLHSLHWTDLTYLMDTWFMIHMFLLLFLVSPTCTLPWSDQSRALTLCSQALTIASLWMSLMLSLLLPSVFNLPVFTFCSDRRAPTNCLYEFPPELRFGTYTLHRLTLILHHFALQCLAIPLSLPYTTPGDDPLPPDHTLRAP